MASYDTEYLVSIMREAAQAGHGQKTVIYQRAADFLGISLPTLHRELAKVRPNTRKQRTDAGDHTLTLSDAKIISAYLMEGYRKNDKKMISIGAAVESLRANGLVTAAAIDADGVMQMLSDSAIARALRTYKVHPEQLRRPSPHIHLKSKHPNHVWQVDASVCTLYYLPSGGSLIETHRAIHYKNKPENIEAITQQRVIRYVITDHCTGMIRWRYYPHSESGENTVKFIAWAVMPKGDLGKDPFYGVPFILMVDPGATAAGLVQRFCDRLSIELHVNKPGAPRSKGSVENGQDIVETNFEQGLRFCSSKIGSIDDLNAIADTYQVYFNATAIHSRHKMTRVNAWMHIKQAELRIINPKVDLLALATSKPEVRVINGDLTINYLSRKWKVQPVPFASVGDDLTVCRNPLNDQVMAIIYDEAGQETYIQLEEMAQDNWGFYEGATIGENYVSHKDTALDRNRKEVAQIATGAESVEEAEKIRRRKGYEAFNGLVDPYKAAKTDLPMVLPKTGSDLADPSITIEYTRKNHAQMAIWLRNSLGDDYSPQILGELKTNYPNGATEPELDEVLEHLRAGRSAAGKARLKAV